MRRFAAYCLMLLLFTTGCKKAAKREHFLPEATNDHFVTVIGGQSDTSESLSSLPASSLAETSSDAVFQPMQIETRPEQPQYPVGTKEIILVVTNHSEQDLLYSEWFDFRRIQKDQVIPLEPRENAMVHQSEESLVLKAGASISLHVPLDIFNEPLTAGVYRVSQLACYAENFACTEITAEFTLE